VQQVLMQNSASLQISIGIVWINMLPFDNAVTARFRAWTMQDPRVRHFHDPARQAGRAVAQSLGAQHKAAWDIYLFYSEGTAWHDHLPPPVIWAHQLSGSDWADPARYRREADLIAELYKARRQLAGAPA
jgi:hypothetical protein